MAAPAISTDIEIANLKIRMGELEIANLKAKVASLRKSAIHLKKGKHIKSMSDLKALAARIDYLYECAWDTYEGKTESHYYLNEDEMIDLITELQVFTLGVCPDYSSKSETDLEEHDEEVADMTADQAPKEKDFFRERTLWEAFRDGFF